MYALGIDRGATIVLYYILRVHISVQSAIYDKINTTNHSIEPSHT